MATKIFPSVNDVNGGVAGQGKTLTEANVKTLQAMPYLDVPYVKSGAVCSNGGGLNLSVATGHYCIDGRWVYKDTTEAVALTASQTNRVWLQLVKDGSGNVTGTTWNVQTGTSVPSDAVLVAEVVTGAATITTITQSHRGIIAPGMQVTNGYAELSATASVAGDKLNMVVVGDGITPMQLSFKVPYASLTVVGGVGVRICDGAGGTGTVYDQKDASVNNAGGAVGMDLPDCAVSAFVGKRTFYLYLPTAAGTPSLFAAATGRAVFRAVWQPTYRNS